MIDAASLALMAQSAVLLMVLWTILFCLWPTVRLDCFRQQIFEVRDELFDYAASGRIAFSHPAYRLLRQSMNGFIRYGHKVSFYGSVAESVGRIVVEKVLSMETSQSGTVSERCRTMVVPRIWTARSLK